MHIYCFIHPLSTLNNCARMYDIDFICHSILTIHHTLIILYMCEFQAENITLLTSKFECSQINVYCHTLANNASYMTPEIHAYNILTVIWHQKIMPTTFWLRPLYSTSKYAYNIMTVIQHHKIMPTTFWRRPLYSTSKYAYNIMLYNTRK